MANIISWPMDRFLFQPTIWRIIMKILWRKDLSLTGMVSSLVYLWFLFHSFPSDAALKSNLCTQMPNPLRIVADGIPLYTSFINLFCDNVSGNHSKSYNKHYNCYATHQNLPRHVLNQEFHIHFVLMSPYASTAEQMEGIKSMIEFVSTLSYCHELIKTDLML